jgi:hypothetical protein
LIDNLSWTHGAHQFSFGANIRFYQQNDTDGSVEGQNVTPSISLSASLLPPGAGFNLPAVASSTAPGISGTDDTRLLSSINDLLGIPAQLKEAFIGNLNTNSFLPTGSRWVVGAREQEYNGYAQDTWHVKKNFTFIAGVRWEWNRPASENSEHPYIPNRDIDGSQGPVTFVPSSSWWTRSNVNVFEPRLGLSWSPFGGDKTVIHAGYGISTDTIPTYYPGAEANSLPGLAQVCTATTYASTTVGCGTAPANTRISQGFPGSLPPPTGTPSALLTPAPQLDGVAPPAVILDPNLKMPWIHQWNITIQRQLPGSIVVQTGYVGNRGERLLSQLDHNQINAGPILPSFNAMEANLAAGCKPDGSACPVTASPQTVPLVANGIVSSAFVNSSSSLTDLAQNAAGDFAGRIEQTTLAAHLRPNQQFSSIIFVSNQADSVYHSMQTTVRRRFGNGLLFNFAWTLSKVIDDQSGSPIGTSFTPTTSTAIDNNNLSLDRGRADFDQRNVVSITWIYELPFGKGRKWMNSAPRFVDQILGGWSLQGFNSNMSGEPFSVTSGARTENFSAVSRAVIVGSSLPGDSLTSVPGGTGPSFFANASAFAIPAPGAEGEGRNMFNGPRFWDMDGALAKSFHATEKVKISFRFEAFNALNHPNFRKLSQESVGSNSILSPNFGTSCCQTLNTTTSTAILSNGEPYRVVQFVLKASF